MCMYMNESKITMLVYIPEPPWPDGGPVLEDGVEPDRNVQSNLSDLSCVQPEHKPLLKLQKDATVEGKSENKSQQNETLTVLTA